MAVKTFAAIDVGSYELAMKIYEIGKHGQMRPIDHVRRSIDLGTGSYSTGKIDYDSLSELFSTLREFRKIMDTYKVDEYVAYATSALREARNRALLLDEIKQISGITVEVISNSEQRFIDYKAVAFMGDEFENFIKEGTAILDVGGGSIQLSLFNKDTLVSTQNMKLGVLRLLERMNTIGASRRQFEMLIGELVDTQLEVYKKLYLRDREIENLILIDDYISPIIHRGIGGKKIENISDIATVNRYIELAQSMTRSELAAKLELAEESIPLLFIALILLQKVMAATGVKNIWAPGVSLCDGIAYEYAEKNGLISIGHSFEEDIIACAKQISKRYMGSRKRSETLEKIALSIFDAISGIYGLSRRDRLLLQLSAILHDCGKYISLSNLAECSYNIIMSTEIIGLSHKERMIVANVVRYNQLPFEYYDELSQRTSIEPEDHRRIAHITAILRIANGLDRSHKMKFREIAVAVKENDLVISAYTDEDITLEKGLFHNRADFFREVYNLRPVISQKRSI